MVRHKLVPLDVPLTILTLMCTERAEFLFFKKKTGT
eukprot:SAG31_NODE_49387_length_142_cov_43.837209_1_plen_35_part_01